MDSVPDVGRCAQEITEITEIKPAIAEKESRSGFWGSPSFSAIAGIAPPKSQVKIVPFKTTL